MLSVATRTNAQYTASLSRPTGTISTPQLLSREQYIVERTVHVIENDAIPRGCYQLPSRALTIITSVLARS